MSSDEILSALRAMKSGDMDGFEPFYEQTKRMVFFAAKAVLKDNARSEDVMQDVYIRFLEMLDRIEEDRGVVGLLVKMARNLALNILEREQRSVELDENLHGSISTTDNPGSDLFERMRKLLDDDEYEIVILHVVDELKHREIAEMMSLPLGTVTWKYNRAIAKLQKGLGDFR